MRSLVGVSKLATLVLALLGTSCAAELHSSVGGSSSSGKERWAEDTGAAWSALQQGLAGSWRATTPENRTITTSYRVVSKGSALVETWTSASGKETISVYHRDGNALMLTHYCAQGNQARLKATEATREKITFSFLDATNVAADQGVMNKLVIVLRPDGFDQETVYRDAASGALDTTTLHFTRADPPPVPATTGHHDD